MRRRSTNPFDSPELVPDEVGNNSSDEFFDCHQEEHEMIESEAPLPVARSGSKIFGAPAGTVEPNQGSDYISPLEHALNTAWAVFSPTSRLDAAVEEQDSTDEVEPLMGSDNVPSMDSSDQSGVAFETPGRKSSITKRRSFTTLNKKTPSTSRKGVNPVLQTLSRNDPDDEADDTGRQIGTPWSKLILLEELGTASSWAILMIPYVAFVLCLILDTYSKLLGYSVGPLDAKQSCFDLYNSSEYKTPMLETAIEPCSYPFALHDGYGILEQRLPNYAFQTSRYHAFMPRGTGFTTGPISDVPPMSSSLRGDATYSEIPAEAMSLVARGMVMTSTVVMQRSKSSTSEWIPVSVSNPEKLSMACKLDHEKQTTSKTWTCSSPRIVDVLFSMPGTSVLSGSDIQVNVLYSVYHNVLDEPTSLVYSDSSSTQSIIKSTNVSDSNAVLAELVASSSYVIQHESLTYTLIGIIVRFVALLFTLAFIVVWCWCFGMKWVCGSLGCGFLCCCLQSDNKKRGPSGEESPLKNKAREASFWWESPWVLFPERLYLLALLWSLVLLQNPLLIVAYFRPVMYSSAAFRTSADAIIGVGLNCYLMLWLCLFQGLRYHTAALARRRAKQQRQVLELRKAARYMAQQDHTDYGTEDFITKYTHDYYDRYGDSAGLLEIRVKHDPYGDHWADFLVPKLFVLLIGIVAVLVASMYRFPSEQTAVLSKGDLRRYNAIYITSSFIQLFILFFWVALIIRNAFRTGRKLKKEPFLSTRPVQLAYRILIGILFLALGSFLVPFFVDLFQLIQKWTAHGTNREAFSSTQTIATTSSAALDVLLRILLHVSERFPYSGTAAGIGPGKVLFSTVCAVLAAFIFLPSAAFMEGEGAHGKGSEGRGSGSMFAAIGLIEKGRRKKDKRMLVTLARHTHTWRVFPLPIKKVPLASLLSDISFRFDDGDRSVAFLGRYTPVFCLETACWLLEASWQTYYSATNFSTDNFAPGRMSLESIGLKLEKAIFDESTHTQAYVATNVAAQVDSEEDNVIVVAFRGTATARAMSIDLKLRQVALLDQIVGLDKPMFQVFPDGVKAFGDDKWFWDTPLAPEAEVKSYSPEKNAQGCLSFRWRHKKQSAVDAMSLGAKAVLKATPMTRQTLPCVHEGFMEAYSHVRKQVWECILEIMQRQLAKSVERTYQDPEDPAAARPSLSLPKIYITGHSLGGSIGQLLALDLASNCELVVELEDPTAPSGENELFTAPMMETSQTENPDSPSRMEPDRVGTGAVGGKVLKLRPPIAVYTYGMPRVGNRPFARLYKERVPHTFRVVNEGDAFTSLPTTLNCGGTYKHAGLEVMLDEGCTGNILVGPVKIETMFRFSRMRTSMAAHSLERYRDCLERGLSQDELHEYYRTRGSTKDSSAETPHGARPSGIAPTPLPDWLTQQRKTDDD